MQLFGFGYLGPFGHFLHLKGIFCPPTCLFILFFFFHFVNFFVVFFFSPIFFLSPTFLFLGFTCFFFQDYLFFYYSFLFLYFFSKLSVDLFFNIELVENLVNFFKKHYGLLQCFLIRFFFFFFLYFSK